jgi:hypothetical protein
MLLTARERLRAVGRGVNDGGLRPVDHQPQLDLPHAVLSYVPHRSVRQDDGHDRGAVDARRPVLRTVAVR